MHLANYLGTSKMKMEYKRWFKWKAGIIICREGS